MFNENHLTWHRNLASKRMTSSSNLSSSWNWLSWYSNRSPKVMEQIMFETALLILKWLSKGCPGGGGRERGSLNIGSFLFSTGSLSYDLTHTRHGAVSLCPQHPEKADTQEVLSQCQDSETEDQDLYSGMCSTIVSMYLILELEGRLYLWCLP